VTFAQLVFELPSVFISQPLLAFIPAAVFGVLFFLNRRLSVLAAAACWTLYAVLETLNKARITCSGECNIRVDLLLIYPLLWIVSIAAVVALLRGRRRRGAA
jgi:hypothetical protein